MTCPGYFNNTCGGASIAIYKVAIITSLDRLPDTIAAVLAFDQALRATPVPIKDVAVITSLRINDHCIPTNRRA
jgi:hypothetical protein